MLGIGCGGTCLEGAILLRQGYGGTGKAVLVEEGEHLGTLIDYVHLNPFRAGLVMLEDGESEAKRMIRRGLSLAGLKKSELAGMKKGDWRKRVIGRLVRRATVMPVGWIAEALQMGDPKRTAKLVQTDPDPKWGKDWKAARKLFVELDK